MKIKRFYKTTLGLLLVINASVSVASGGTTLPGDHVIVSSGSGPSAEAGNLTVSGNISTWGGIDLGTTAGSPPLSALQLDFHSSGALAKTATFDLTEANSAFAWRDNLEGGTSVRTKMRLDGDNSLSLFNSAGTTAGLVLNGNTGTITASAINVSGSPVVTSSSLSSSITQLPTVEVGGVISGLNWSSAMALGSESSAMAGSLAVGYNADAMTIGALAVGWGVQAIGARAVAFGHATEAHGVESIALGRWTKAYGDMNFVGGWQSQSLNFNSFAYGDNCVADSQAPGGGYESDSFAIAMGAHAGALGFQSTAIGYFARANATGAMSIGNGTVANTQYEFATGSMPHISQETTGWNETDALFRLGNGVVHRSEAITTLKNGQTTLTNKAWKQDPQVAESASNSNGEALVVDGNTRLRGKVILEKAQGDISMGIYE